MTTGRWLLVRDAFVTLAVTLAVLAVLAVPPAARADDDTGTETVTFEDCVAACINDGGNYNDCQALCGIRSTRYCTKTSPFGATPCNGWCYFWPAYRCSSVITTGPRECKCI